MALLYSERNTLPPLARDTQRPALKSARIVGPNDEFADNRLHQGWLSALRFQVPIDRTEARHHFGLLVLHTSVVSLTYCRDQNAVCVRDRRHAVHSGDVDRSKSVQN